jgi:hypothetical protein
MNINLKLYYSIIYYIITGIIFGIIFEKTFNYIYGNNNKNKSIYILFLEFITQINILVTGYYIIKYCLFNISPISNYYTYINNNDIFIIFTYIFLGFQLNLQNKLLSIINYIKFFL